VPSPLQYSVNLCRRGTAERPGKRASEILTQERVDDWINCAVSVAEDRNQLIELPDPRPHAGDVLCDDLEQPIW